MHFKCRLIYIVLISSSWKNIMSVIQKISLHTWISQEPADIEIDRKDWKSM